MISTKSQDYVLTKQQNWLKILIHYKLSLITFLFLFFLNGLGATSTVILPFCHFDVERDIIVTTTIEAAKDLKERLAQRMGAAANGRVRTMASILMNGLRESERDRYNRLLIDEALMNHFGAIVMAVRITGAAEVVLIGDRNKLPFIDRNNLFSMKYHRPDLVTSISLELLCSYRNPMDVAYALSEVYSGIYSSTPRIRSLKLHRFMGAQIPKTLPGALYLVYTQEEKQSLIDQGYGTGAGSRTLTIHEAQGLTLETVVIVRAESRGLQLHSSVPHAVVAVSRHTARCVYYTDDTEDATYKLIRRAETAPAQQIWDYNLKMAMRNRDEAVMTALLRVGGRED